LLYGGFCSFTVTLGKVSSRKALSASACPANSSGVPRSVIVGLCTVQYSMVTTSRLWLAPSLRGSASSGLCRLGSLTLVKSKTSLVFPSGAARSVGRLRVLAAGAVDGRPRASTFGIERVDGLHCSFPVEPKVTNRSQPFVDAQIERAEAEEALRTPLRPSGRVLAGVVGDDAMCCSRNRRFSVGWQLRTVMNKPTVKYRDARTAHTSHHARRQLFAHHGRHLHFIPAADERGAKSAHTVSLNERI
jgi:hypothetical protein